MGLAIIRNPIVCAQWASRQRFVVPAQLQFQSNWGISGGSRGGETGAPPPQMNDYVFSPMCIRLHKNKAQIARESMKTPEASRTLKRALDPRRKGLRILRS